MRQVALLGILMSMALAGGCAGASGPVPGWVERRGGIVDGAYQQRLEQACAPLLAQCGGCSCVRLHVLNTREVIAYSWASGDVYVTAGLMACLSDEELRAAVAHELGHLLIAGHFRLDNPVSLRGAAGRWDVEARADAVGAVLLERSGTPREAMAEMLGRVRIAGRWSDEGMRALEKREQLLRASIAPDPAGKQ